MILREIADFLACVWFTGRLPEQLRLSLPVAGDAQENLDKRGLAGPVLTQQTVDFSPVHAQGNFSERLNAAVILAQLSGFQNRHANRLSLCLGGYPMKTRDSRAGKPVLRIKEGEWSLRFDIGNAQSAAAFEDGLE